MDVKNKTVILTSEGLFSKSRVAMWEIVGKSSTQEMNFGGGERKLETLFEEVRIQGDNFLMG